MREWNHECDSVMLRYGLTPDHRPVVVIHLND
jgi:hypothetical protein